ncbi:MAG: mannosyltransferase family protein [Mycobacteriales bacterium]
MTNPLLGVPPGSPAATPTRHSGIFAHAPLAGRIPPWVWRTLGLYAVTRAVVALVFPTAQVLGDAPLGRLLTAWDSLWYLSIARYGYPRTLAPQYLPHHGNSLAFFPLYPALVRGLATVLGGDVVIAGYLLNFVLGAVAVLLLRALFTDLETARATPDLPAADRAVALFITFPGAVVLSLAYAEALTITLAAACLWALYRQRWAVAGLAALLAGATRPNALPLVAACGWAAVAAIARRRQWAALLAPALAPLGALAFFWWEDARTGVHFAFQVVERAYWGQHLDFSTGLPKELRLLSTRALTGDAAEVWIILAGMVFLVPVLVLLARSRLPWPVLIYTLGVLALCLAYTQVGARPRYLLTAFPLFLPLGRALRGAALQAVLLLGTAAGALLLALYLAPVHLTP